MSAQTHQSDPRVLDRRTLQQDHRVLAGMLRPGMSVVDAGCGTGSITAGIAEAVGPAGHVLGIDRDQALIDWANSRHGSVAQLSFEAADLLTWNPGRDYDIATAARALQWMADPSAAVQRLASCLKPGGCLVVLDYNHALISWTPTPPPAFLEFYDAFLTWREAHDWSNRIAGTLPALFTAAGLRQIESISQPEAYRRGDPGLQLWSLVMETLGPSMVAEGYLPESTRHEAARAYSQWQEQTAEQITLDLYTCVGTKVCGPV